MWILAISLMMVGTAWLPSDGSRGDHTGGEVSVFSVAEKTFVRGRPLYTFEGVVVSVDLTVRDFHRIRRLVESRARSGDHLIKILSENVIPWDERLKKLEGISPAELVTAVTWNCCDGPLSDSGQLFVLLRVSNGWAVVTVYELLS